MQPLFRYACPGKPYEGKPPVWIVEEELKVKEEARKASSLQSVSDSKGHFFKNGIECNCRHLIPMESSKQQLNRKKAPNKNSRGTAYRTRH